MEFCIEQYDLLACALNYVLNFVMSDKGNFLILKYDCNIIKKVYILSNKFSSKYWERNNKYYMK